MTRDRMLIIGIGNPYRCDDALGCLIVRELAKSIPLRVECIEHDGEPASLIDSWQHKEHVLLIDAVSSGATPGHIFRFDLTHESLPEAFNLYSTHAFGIPQAVELARVLGKLPAKIDFIGIEGQSFGAGQRLSAQVQTAKNEVIAEILNSLESKKK